MNKSLEILKICPACVCVSSLAEAEAAVSAGAEALEVDCAGGVLALAAICRCFSAEVLVGAGCVRSAERAFEAVDSGAQFIATDTTDTAIYKTCDGLSVPVIGEALTPRELRVTVALGSRMAKLFPSCMITPEYLAALQKLELCELSVSGAEKSAAAGFKTNGAVCVFIPFSSFIGK